VDHGWLLYLAPSLLQGALNRHNHAMQLVNEDETIAFAELPESWEPTMLAILAFSARGEAGNSLEPCFPWFSQQQGD